MKMEVSKMIERKIYISKILSYAFLIVFGLVMIYPLLCLFASSFKLNEDIFKSLSLIQHNFITDTYLQGCKGTGQYTFGTFFTNTFILVIPTVLFTVLSSTLVAYGFARFNFPLKKILFSLMLATLVLPNSVIMVQQEAPLFSKDGGHGMLFKTFDGDLMLTIDSPNTKELERPIFIKVIDEDGKLTIK